MYVIIKQPEKYFFHCDGKIVLFETQEEANFYFQEFQKYAMSRLAQERGPFGLGEGMQVLSQCVVYELDFEEPPCGFITFKEVVEKGQRGM